MRESVLEVKAYRQQSVSRRLFQKLDAKYYGPFEVLARIGKVAYCLALTESSRIHPVFHISQLKPVVGTSAVATPLPPTFSDSADLLIEPETVMDMMMRDTWRFWWSGSIFPIMSRRG